MASVYTVETLLALKPAKGFQSQDPRVLSYLALWRKYHRLAATEPKRCAPDSTVVMQYQLGTPNKVFRRRWIHTHGTTEGLSSLPRYPMRVFSVRVKFLELHVRMLRRILRLIQDQFHALRQKGLLGRGQVTFGPPGPSAPVLKPVQVVETTTLVRTPAVKYSVRDAVLKRQKLLLKKSRLEHDDKIAMQTFHDGRDSYSSPTGGLTRADYGPYKLPPPKDGRSWKKYWYFFRKRGEWLPSEHHPYGDEIPVITDWVMSRKRDAAG